MAGYNDNYNQQNPNYWSQGNSASYNFGMPAQELNFQSFTNDATQENYSTNDMYEKNSYMSPMSTSQQYHGEIFTPQSPSFPPNPYSGGDNFDDEPPLLEELGINPDYIMQKTLSVLNPFRKTDAYILQDSDFTGPLIFCIAFGAFLLLSGKVHFNYIYGIGVSGCLGLYALLNMMASSGVGFGVVVSVMGYCLLPMVALSGVNVFFSLYGTFGFMLTGLAIFWCSLSASKLFVTALSMEHQQPLVAYPCALVYSVFALITVF